MSTETVAPEATEVPTEETAPAKVITPLESLSDLSQGLVKRAQDIAASIKAVAEKQAKVGDVGKLLSEAIESSEDPKVKELRVKRERASKAILEMDKAMEGIVKPTLSIPTEAELTAMDVEYKTYASQLNTFNQVFVTEVTKDHPELTLFDYVGEIPGKRRGAKAGQGTGVSRPRLTSVEYTKDKNGEEGFVKAEKDGKSTFTHLAQVIKAETGEVPSASEFTEAWNKSNGTSEWTDNPEQSKFVYTVTDKEGKTHTYWVRVTR